MVKVHLIGSASQANSTDGPSVRLVTEKSVAISKIFETARHTRSSTGLLLPGRQTLKGLEMVMVYLIGSVSQAYSLYRPSVGLETENSVAVLTNFDQTGHNQSSTRHRLPGQETLKRLEMVKVHPVHCPNPASSLY